MPGRKNGPNLDSKQAGDSPLFSLPGANTGPDNKINDIIDDVTKIKCKCKLSFKICLNLSMGFNFAFEGQMRLFHSSDFLKDQKF